MLNIKKIVLLTSMAFLIMVQANEPSVYGAGNIESANPYGLTQTERTVLENKKTIQMLYNKITEQQRKVDGLSSIIEGQNKEIVDLKEQLGFQVKTYREESKQLLSKVSEDANKSYTLLLELGKIIDEIKNAYVSRTDFENSLASIRDYISENKTISVQSTGISENRESTYENVNSNISEYGGAATEVNNADLYREGVQLFYQQSYDASKENFEKVLTGNYKAAPSNFYLGEIAYNTHQYAEAVSYYKQSALLYDSASYMDVLYLHTAISLDKSGDPTQARQLYEYVISTYPDKKSASIARNRLAQ